jgi:hypothetical protein
LKKIIISIHSTARDSTPHHWHSSSLTTYGRLETNIVLVVVAI